jgi:(p)ppGpp synthase/HD superfamily hydrolase
MAVTIDSLVQEVQSYSPSIDEKRIRDAYAFAASAHEGQVRFSGEPYVTHPLEAAGILLSLKPDEDTIIATLLHDVPADTSTSLNEIEKKFGSTVSRLVLGTEKLSLVRVQGGQAQVESWRRMFLAMAKDLRVIFIKLSERLHNMRTLEYVAEDKQLRIADETLRVYAPIASRLGIYSIKSELEDLCFKFLYPQEYAHLKEEIEEHGQMNQHCIEEAQRVLSSFLEDEDIEAEVSGRIKHMYSIYKKLRKKNTSRLASVHDLFAIRIVLKDSHREGREFVGPCYTALGAIHNRWVPMPGRFKDYIAVPKLNGYRSLHTTVLNLLPDLSSQPVEIQIRTESMHREAEYGVASHWWYEDTRRASSSLSRDEVESVLRERRLMAKVYAFLDHYPKERPKFESLLSEVSSGKKLLVDKNLRALLLKEGFSSNDIVLLSQLHPGKESEARTTFFQHQVDWLVGLEQLNDDLQDSDLSEEGMEVNLFEDRIFVLTPEGDVKDLPVGSTPVDFAYSIHSDVGNRCYQAKLNGKIVRLDHELNSGDIVEVLTRKQPNPSRYWLSFVKTAQARNKIKAWFRTLDRDKNIKAGRAMLNKGLRDLGKPLLGPNFSLLKLYGGTPLDLAHREHIVEQVGDGTTSVNHVIRALFSEEDLLGQRVAKPSVHQPVVKPIASKAALKNVVPSEVLITGERDMPFTLSACCKPRYPHVIIGYVTRGQSIRIHRKNCREISDIDSGRLLAASWMESQAQSHYQVHLRLEFNDRVGVLKDVVGTVEELSISIIDFPFFERTPDGVMRDLMVEVSDYDILTRLMYKLEGVDGMRSVKKV